LIFAVRIRLSFSELREAYLQAAHRDKRVLKPRAKTSVPRASAKWTLSAL